MSPACFRMYSVLIVPLLFDRSFARLIDFDPLDDTAEGLMGRGQPRPAVSRAKTGNAASSRAIEKTTRAGIDVS